MYLHVLQLQSAQSQYLMPILSVLVVSVLCRMVSLPSTVRLGVDTTQQWSCCWKEEHLYLPGPRCVSYRIRLCLEANTENRHADKDC